jgi:hypothetical protein
MILVEDGDAFQLLWLLDFLQHISGALWGASCHTLALWELHHL